MSKTVCFSTLGCKVNQYDTQAMLELFEARGYVAVPPGKGADVYVVNTCTVTGTGDQKSMKLVRRCRRENPAAELVIAGCLAQRLGEELRDTGARLILGTQYRGQVVELLEKAIQDNTQTVAVSGLESAAFEALSIRRHEGHTRAAMKIQEGCDCHCTYCVIPSVRGAVRSRALEDIRQEAATLGKAGFSELVLTGIHLSSYGIDLPGKPDLARAVQAACGQEGILRVRLGSLEPGVATEAFVNALAELPQCCPQFHLALQSGSDSVLARMKRRYNTAQYEAAANRIRARFPGAAFTTDVIVGFPGETEEEFQQTLAFCERIGFARLHVFPYSKRKSTPAAAMAGQVSDEVKQERVRRLMELGEAMMRAYHEAQRGHVREVLLEERRPDDRWEGYTPEYVHTLVEGNPALTGSLYPGQIVQVCMGEPTGEGMTGVLME